MHAQPLFLSKKTMAGGQLNIVYVATENNTIYAFYLASRRILLSQNYGPPVLMSALPCQPAHISEALG